jgi:uncharacterized protein with PIN domain
MRATTRFVTDASLEQLARRLRMLGYDVATHRGARLEELFAAAAAEGRTVLTLSRRAPPRAAPAAVMVVPRADLAAALRLVAAGHAPATARWSRCPGCNVALHRRTAFEARGEVPGPVTRRGGPLSWCPSCGRWFWPGSHVARLEAWFQQVLGPEPPVEGEAT